MAGSAQLLSFKNLACRTEQGRMLFSALSGSVSAGGALLIRGANGTGKTSLLQCLLGFQKYDRGEVQLGFERKELSYLPQLQDSTFHIPMTLRDVLQVSSPAFDERSACDLGLLDREQLQLGWNTASGGERRKTLLTRLFISRPKLFVLDEPFNHLDHQTEECLKTALLNRLLAQEYPPAGLIMVSHDRDFDQRVVALGLPLTVIELAESL